mmetsp:Transcript_22960/g.34515  ORF Transcript_22960/g.34515 Transcript_22960/m.34515 type:complete len:245 (-) Transcript_22960:189-923(-)
MTKGGSESKASRQGGAGGQSQSQRQRQRQRLARLVLQRPASGKSTKELSANLRSLGRHLGKHCPHFGKKGVVQLAAPQLASAALEGAEEIGPPKFNKYAGWVEWKNTVFLWVNAVGGSFDNNFRANGREVNWYVGGANPSDSSPIVKRLLTLSSSRAAKPGFEVCLFVRARATEPYVFCGRCNYRGHNGQRKGYEFNWRLSDYPKLVKCPAFRELLALQKPAAAAAVATAATRRAGTRAAARWT